MELGWNFLPVHGIVERACKELQILHTLEGEWLAFSNYPPLSNAEQTFLTEFLHGFRQSSVESELSNAFAEQCWKQGIALDAKQKKYLFALAKASVKDFGPLQSLLECEWLEEIAVTGCGKEHPVRCFDSQKGWLPCNFYFESEETVRDWINLLGRGIGRRITLQHPKLSASLSNKNRVHATIPPLSETPTVTIRKFREKPWSCLELAEKGTLSWNALAFLSLCLQSDCSMVVVGNTGSGKTTTLNALLQFFPLYERIVLVEETPEMRCLHGNAVRLVSGEHASMSELIWDTLRMRPDRIVVGEVRTPEEVKALMDTILAGQGKGSCATLHGQNVSEMKERLKSYGVRGEELSSIDLCIVQRRWSRPGEKIDCRKVVEIAEGSSNGFRTLYGFNFEQNILEKKMESIRLNERICRSYAIPCNQVEGLVEETEERLRSLSAQHLDATGFFEKWNGKENDGLERELEAVL